MPQVITGKMVELLRANKLQDAVQKLQEMVKTNQFMNLKHIAKLADSIGMRRLKHFVRPSCIPFFRFLGFLWFFRWETNFSQFLILPNSAGSLLRVTPIQTPRDCTNTCQPTGFHPDMPDTDID